MAWIKLRPFLKKVQRLWLYDRADSSHNVSWSPTVPWYQLSAEEYYPREYNIYSGFVTRNNQKKIYIKGNYYGYLQFISESSYVIYLQDLNGTNLLVLDSGSWKGSFIQPTKTINVEVDISNITASFRIRVYLYAKSGSTGLNTLTIINLSEVYAE